MRLWYALAEGSSKLLQRPLVRWIGKIWYTGGAALVAYFALAESENLSWSKFAALVVLIPGLVWALLPKKEGYSDYETQRLMCDKAFKRTLTDVLRNVEHRFAP